MVPKTSDDFPEPETPVNTVNRRLGMSREMSARLFSLAPRTWMTSWLSATKGCSKDGGRGSRRGGLRHSGTLTAPSDSEAERFRGAHDDGAGDAEAGGRACRPWRLGIPLGTCQTWHTLEGTNRSPVAVATGRVGAP